MVLVYGQQVRKIHERLAHKVRLLGYEQTLCFIGEGSFFANL